MKHTTLALAAMAASNAQTSCEACQLGECGWHNTPTTQPQAKGEFGDPHQEALMEYAVKNEIKLWNEQ